MIRNYRSDMADSVVRFNVLYFLNGSSTNLTVDVHRRKSRVGREEIITASENKCSEAIPPLTFKTRFYKNKNKVP